MSGAQDTGKWKEGLSPLDFRGVWHWPLKVRSMEYTRMNS
jgi:hypothetical protein